MEPGSAVVIYTDGVVEARREGELFGVERLDAVLADGRELSARELAASVTKAAAEFAGELADDCAVVVVQRSAEGSSGASV
jgi:serine phosphatase RsbU (regulator of sigma subunit)